MITQIVPMERKSSKRHNSTIDDAVLPQVKKPDLSILQDNTFPTVSHDELSCLLRIHDSTPLPECENIFPWLHGYASGCPAPPEFPSCCAIVRSSPIRSTDQRKGSKQEAGEEEEEEDGDDGEGGQDEEIIENSGLLRSSLDPLDFFIPLNSLTHDLRTLVSLELNKLNNNVSPQFVDSIVSTCQYYKVLPFFITDEKAQYMYGCEKRCVGMQQDKSAWQQPGLFRRFDLQPAKIMELAKDIVVYCLNDTHEKKECHCWRLAAIIAIAKNFVSRGYSHGAGATVSRPCRIRILETTQVTNDILGTPKMPLNTLDKPLPEQLASKFDIASFNNWDKDLLYRERLETSKMSSATCVDQETSLWCGNATDYEIYKVCRPRNGTKPIPQREYYSPENTIVTMEKLETSDTSDPLKNDSKLFNIPQPDKPWILFIRCLENANFPSLATVESFLQGLDSKDLSITEFTFPSSGSIGLGSLNLNSVSIILNVCHLIFEFSSMRADNASLIYCSDGYTESSFLMVAYLIYSWDLPLEQVLLKLHNVSQRPFFLFPIDLQVLGHLQILLREYSPRRRTKTESLTSLEIDSETFSKIFLTKPPKDSFSLQLKGPLPSRILAHLYLGSLEHAQCPSLLKELGIQNIVSVGEALSWAAPTRNNGDNSITTTEKDGFRVFHIDNLADNGHDPLLAPLEHILEFIDDVYKRGEKVLVHCMVGVSRSATVCIAETMKRLRCDVLRAYLFVRVRRLNIIIQPNLMFMYELCKWQELHRIEDKKLRSVDWHIMCRAISELNSNYI